MRRDVSVPSFRDVIIFDNGGHTIKCGLASDESNEPRLVPNCVGRLKGDRVAYVGDAVSSCRDAATLGVRRPVDRGYVCAWSLQRDVWLRAARHALGQSRQQIRQSLLLVTEPPFTLQAIRRAAAEAALLELGAAGVVFATPAELAVAAACAESAEQAGAWFAPPLDGLAGPETDPPVPFLAPAEGKAAEEKAAEEKATEEKAAEEKATEEKAAEEKAAEKAGAGKRKRETEAEGCGGKEGEQGRLGNGGGGGGQEAGGEDGGEEGRLAPSGSSPRSRDGGAHVLSALPSSRADDRSRAAAASPVSGRVAPSFAGLSAPFSGIARAPALDVVALASSCGCGLVVDAGFSFCHATAVFEGRPLPAATVRVDVGGKALTNALADALSLRSVNVRGQPLLVDRIKETLCFVSPAPARDLARCGRRARGRSPFRAQYILPDGVRDAWGRVRGAPGAREPDDAEAVASLDAERFAVPELLFSPADVGLGECGIAEAAARAAQRAHPALRPMLLGNVLVVGGSAATPGFAPRLARELRALAPADLDLRVRAARNPVAAAYRGARLLARNRDALAKRAIAPTALTGNAAAWQPTMERALEAAIDAPAWRPEEGRSDGQKREGAEALAAVA